MWIEIIYKLCGYTSALVNDLRCLFIPSRRKALVDGHAAGEVRAGHDLLVAPVEVGTPQAAAERRPIDLAVHRVHGHVSGSFLDLSLYNHLQGTS